MGIDRKINSWRISINCYRPVDVSSDNAYKYCCDVTTKLNTPFIC